MSDPVSPKSKAVTAVLCLFLGGLGVHRWYVGKVGTGLILPIMIIGGAGASETEIGPFVLLAGSIWLLLDLVAILINKFTDGEDRLIVSAMERVAAAGRAATIEAAAQRASEYREPPLKREPSPAGTNIEQRILLVAKHKGGVLVPTDVAMTTGIGIDAAQRHMESMVQRGHMQMHVRHDGILVYTVPDMLTDEGRESLDTI